MWMWDWSIGILGAAYAWLCSNYFPCWKFLHIFLDQSLAIARPSTSVARQFTNLRVSFRLNSSAILNPGWWANVHPAHGWRSWMKIYGQTSCMEKWSNRRQTKLLLHHGHERRNCRHLRPDRLRATPELTQLQAWHSNRQPQQSTGCAVTRRQTLLRNWRLLLEMPHRAAVIATVWSRGATLLFQSKIMNIQIVLFQPCPRLYWHVQTILHRALECYKRIWYQLVQFTQMMYLEVNSPLLARLNAPAIFWAAH